jgi:hypothetical protein
MSVWLPVVVLPLQQLQSEHRIDAGYPLSVKACQ